MILREEVTIEMPTVDGGNTHHRGTFDEIPVQAAYSILR
jgi:hypothetical protein